MRVKILLLVIFEEKHPPFVNMKFALPLKRALGSMFNIREGFEGKSKKSREWRERPNELFEKILGVKGATPRMFLQQFSTECVRGWRPNFWVDMLSVSLEEALQRGLNVCITDLRFDNEAEMIKKYDNSYIIKIMNVEQVEEKPKSNHISEKGIDKKYIDFGVMNFGDDTFTAHLNTIYDRIIRDGKGHSDKKTT